jgi:hypothetical protein
VHHIVSLHKLASKVAHHILGLGLVLGEERKLPAPPPSALCDESMLRTLFNVPFCLHQPHIHVNGNNSNDCNISGEALSISDLEGFTKIGAHMKPNTRLILVILVEGFNEHKDLLL